ncbi:hypothetical protein DFH09DRAFT_1327196 [Mycena vulgaris]|nr:hypothetical protein DFH09DRAFT_1327196 [Mycena vulgaris]
MKLSVPDAERILSILKASDVQDHLLPDNVAHFFLSFGVGQNGAMNLIRAGLEVANDLTSLLDKLGRGRKFVETLLNFGVAASEVRQSTLSPNQLWQVSTKFIMCVSFS